MAPDELRAIVRDAFDASLEVAHVTEDGDELTVATVDGEDYTVRIAWAGGLHPSRTIHSDGASRERFAGEVDHG